MKPGNGVMKLLILVEIVMLVAVVVLGVIQKIGAPQEKENSVAHTFGQASEQDTSLGAEDIEEAEDTEKTEYTEDTQVSVSDETGTEQEAFSREVKEKLAVMTLEEKVSQMFLVTPETLTNTENVNMAGRMTQEAIGQYPIGGLVYSEHNFLGREQVKNLMTGAGEFCIARIELYPFLAVADVAAQGNPIVWISEDDKANALVEILASEQLTEGAEGAIRLEEPVAQVEATEPAILCYEYKGLLLTESLSAEHITVNYSAKEAAVKAVSVGADMLYQPADFTQAWQAVVDAVQSGALDEARIDRAVGRILTVKYAIQKLAEEAEPDAATE